MIYNLYCNQSNIFSLYGGIAMREETKTIKIYNYSELSEKAKEFVWILIVLICTVI